MAGAITLYPEQTARLRRHLARHNGQVVVIALLTVAAAALLWGAAWFVVYWLVLFSLSVWHGGDAAMPARFNEEFATIALFLMVLAWIDRRFMTDERAVDRKLKLEIFFDFVLMPARITLSICGSLRAWQNLNEDEVANAAALLARIQAERKLAEHSVPLEVPDDATRERVVFALLLLGLAEQRREDGVAWLHAVAEPAPKPPAPTS